MENQEAFKARAEKAMYFGQRVADMSRDQLLVVIGHLGEVLEFQGKQLYQSALNQTALTEALAATFPAQSADQHPSQR